MAHNSSLAAKRVHFLNRWHARRVGRASARAIGFVSAPEPRVIGSFARGQQLLAGNFLFAFLELRPEYPPPTKNNAKNLTVVKIVF